jgi:hypothetical protein
MDDDERIIWEKAIRRNELTKQLEEVQARLHYYEKLERACQKGTPNYLAVRDTVKELSHIRSSLDTQIVRLRDPEMIGGML